MKPILHYESEDMRPPVDLRNEELLARKLQRFMESFQIPEGLDPMTFLQYSDKLMNPVNYEVPVVHGLKLRTTKDWTLQADVYIPPQQIQRYSILYIHGGAWTMGSPYTHRGIGQEFARRGYVTALLDYRRAPKHRFPAAVDDCEYAVRVLGEKLETLGIDSGNLVLAGDSAGANLAAAVMTDSRNSVHISAALLFYGIYNFYDALPVLSRLVGGIDANEQIYLAENQFESLKTDPRVNPILRCEAFPRTYLSVGTMDPLQQETFTLAASLKDAKIRHKFVIWPGKPHGFLQLPFLDGFNQVFDDPCEFLDQAETT